MPFFAGRCYSSVKLVGKTAIITGCNTGIGKETVLDFYKRGAKVILACRSIDKAEQTKSDIETSCKDLEGTGLLTSAKCDLSSFKSIRDFAQKILDTEPQVNILVNNAGVMMCPYTLTEDGYEMQFATNHLGHFLLTLLLLPRLRSSKPARIVTVSSKAHVKNILNLDDLNYKKLSYHAGNAYAQSKLANVMFSRELANKLKEHNIEGVNTYSLHPGLIKTELGRHFDETLFRGARRTFGFLLAPFMKTPELGAQTTIYCAVDDKCKEDTGLYYRYVYRDIVVNSKDHHLFKSAVHENGRIGSVDKFQHMKVSQESSSRIFRFIIASYSKTFFLSDCAVARPSNKAVNDELCKKLWDLSVEMTGLSDYNPFTAADPGTKDQS